MPAKPAVLKRAIKFCNKNSYFNFPRLHLPHDIAYDILELDLRIFVFSTLEFRRLRSSYLPHVKLPRLTSLDASFTRIDALPVRKKQIFVC